MAGSKETPRQKMMSMMYLVLTALLALNVSKDVIDAFLVVNENVELRNQKYSEKIKNTYNAFEKMYRLNQVEVEPFWTKAHAAKALSVDLKSFIENLRDELISVTENIPIEEARTIIVRDLKQKDNFSQTTRYLMNGAYDGKGSRAESLKEKIIVYRKQMIDLVDPINRGQLKFGLITDSVYYDADGKKQNWESHNFYQTILAADITILNKLITEVYDAEFEVINTLMNEINADDFSYDKIDAKLLPFSNYVFQGDEYKAEVIVAAYDTSQSPQIYIKRGVDSLSIHQIDEATSLINKNGKALIRLPSDKIGINKYAGLVGVKNASGDVNYFPFSNEYIVAKPSIMVSVEEMNVLYAGVENTVSISASGIPQEHLIPRISIGSIHADPKASKWIVTVPFGETQTEVSVLTELNGVKREMGRQKFRIKRLPDPIATIANKKEGFINKDILITAGAIVPKMPGDFGFELYFRITSFKMTIQRGFNIYHFTAENGVFTEEMIEQIEVTNRGQSILFENIIAKGPSGDGRLLSPIVLTIE